MLCRKNVYTLVTEQSAKYFQSLPSIKRLPQKQFGYQFSHELNRGCTFVFFRMFLVIIEVVAGPLLLLRLKNIRKNTKCTRRFSSCERSYPNYFWGRRLMEGRDITAKQCLIRKWILFEVVRAVGVCHFSFQTALTHLQTDRQIPPPEQPRTPPKMSLQNSWKKSLSRLLSDLSVKRIHENDSTFACDDSADTLANMSI